MVSEKKKKGLNKKVFFLVLVLIASLAALIAMEYGRTVTNGKIVPSENTTINSFKYDAGSKADFAVFGENIYYCTKDGMQFLSSSGEVIWNDTYNMTTPYMVQNQGIVGVSEHKGRVLIVYGGSGKLYSVDAQNKIVSFSVNSSGFSSVITSNDNEYQLEVYDNNGEKTFYGSFQPLQGMPLSSSVSKDGNVLAVSFLSIDDIDVQSKVLFYDISPQTKNTGETSSSVFASFHEENAVCGVVNFFDESSAAVVSDKSLTFINVSPTANEKYSEKWKVEFKNQIKQVAFDSNLNTYIAFGDKLINAGKDALESGTVECFDKGGTKKFEILTKRKVTGIYPSEDNFIIGMDRKFQAYSNSGNFIWEHNAYQDVKKMLFIEGTDLILFVGTNEASIIKLNDNFKTTPSGVDEEEDETEQPEVLEAQSVEEAVTQEQEDVTQEQPKAEEPEKETTKQEKRKETTQNKPAVSERETTKEQTTQSVEKETAQQKSEAQTKKATEKAEPVTEKAQQEKTEQGGTSAPTGAVGEKEKPKTETDIPDGDIVAPEG